MCVCVCVCDYVCVCVVCVCEHRANAIKAGKRIFTERNRLGDTKSHTKRQLVS